MVEEKRTILVPPETIAGFGVPMTGEVTTTPMEPLEIPKKYSTVAVKTNGKTMQIPVTYEKEDTGDIVMPRSISTVPVKTNGETFGIAATYREEKPRMIPKWEEPKEYATMDEYIKSFGSLEAKRAEETEEVRLLKEEREAKLIGRERARAEAAEEEEKTSFIPVKKFPIPAAGSVTRYAGKESEIKEVPAEARLMEQMRGEAMKGREQYWATTRVMPEKISESKFGKMTSDVQKDIEFEALRRAGRDVNRPEKLSRAEWTKSLIRVGGTEEEQLRSERVRSEAGARFGTVMGKVLASQLTPERLRSVPSVVAIKRERDWRKLEPKVRKWYFSR
jgi:hypothetical protein